MTDESFRIYVEQLRDGHSESLTESFSPEFVNVKEKELSFVDPVNIQGEAYLADDELVLHLNIDTLATMPCRICNETFKHEVKIKDFYHAQPVQEIKGRVFDFREVLREVILLETPPLMECHQGKCPKRKAMQKFLKSEGISKKDEEEGYRPFADLDLNK